MRAVTVRQGRQGLATIRSQGLASVTAIGRLVTAAIEAASVAGSS